MTNATATTSAKPETTSGPTGRLALFEACLGIAVALTLTVRNLHDSTTTHGELVVTEVWAAVSGVVALASIVWIASSLPTSVRWITRIAAHLCVWPVIWFFGMVALADKADDLPWNRSRRQGPPASS